MSCGKRSDRVTVGKACVRKKRIKPPSAKKRSIGRRSRKNLLLLPGEIRNVIYGFALKKETPILAVAFDHDGTKDRESPVPEPGLLRVCRQIRAEASAIFWRNTFYDFHVVGNHSPISERSWFRWLMWLPVEKRALPKSFRIKARPVGRRLPWTRTDVEETEREVKRRLCIDYEGLDLSAVRVVMKEDADGGC